MFFDAACLSAPHGGGFHDQSVTGGIKMKPPGGAEIQIKFGVYDVFLLFILAAPF